MDFSSKNLQIKTRAPVHSENLEIRFFETPTGNNQKAGQLDIEFTNPPKFRIGNCLKDSVDFNVTLPLEDENVWEIVRQGGTGNVIQLICNEIEVMFLSFNWLQIFE